jgi:hypothetical protein
MPRPGKSEANREGVEKSKAIAGKSEANGTVALKFEANAMTPRGNPKPTGHRPSSGPTTLARGFTIGNRPGD